jgi:hypothetical protein
VASIFNVAPTTIKERRRFGRAVAAALHSREYFSLNNNNSDPSSSLFASAFPFSFYFGFFLSSYTEHGSKG